MRTRIFCLVLLSFQVFACTSKPSEGGQQGPPATSNPPGNQAPSAATNTASQPAQNAPVVGGAPKDPKAEAQEIFATRCSTCHGTEGRGDGPGAAALNPKPRDYTNADWQKSVTDDHIRTIIVQGGPSVGKSPLMPPNPDLASKPEVVNELLKIVRGFKK
jgi:mono/diheme cytochrome c family protein